MFTSEDETRRLPGSEPPFLQEATPQSQQWDTKPAVGDQVADFIDRRRPTVLMGLLAVVVGLAGTLAVFSGDDIEADDPLALPAGPLVTVAVKDKPDLGVGSGGDSNVPATVGPAVVPPAVNPLSLTGTSSPTSGSTSAFTTTTTDLTTTTVPTSTVPTTVESTTTLDPTTTTGSTVIELTGCQVRVKRNTRVYVSPTTSSEEIARIRGTVPATAFTDADGGWVAVELESGSGWIQASDIRRFEGDCG